MWRIVLRKRAEALNLQEWNGRRSPTRMDGTYRAGLLRLSILTERAPWVVRHGLTLLVGGVRYGRVSAFREGVAAHDFRKSR